MAQALPELPRINRLLYASGSIAGNVISRSKDLWLIFFYAPPQPGEENPWAVYVSDFPEEVTTLVPRLLLGALIMAVRVIEALDDPLIGWWSDRTRSRWGRRIPFVLAATPFYALFYVLLFAPRAILPEQTTLVYALYFFLILQAFHLFSTLSGGPFESLLPEIAVTSKDRVSIVTWQVAFGSLGAFVGLVVSGLILDNLGIEIMALVMATIAFASRYLALGGAWRHVNLEAEPVRISPIKAIRSTFSNDQFLFFLPTFIFFNMSITMMTAALPFFADAVLGFEETGTVVAALTAVAIIVVMASLPVVYRLSLYRGKAWVYGTAMLLGALYMPWIFFMGFIPGLPKLGQAFFFVALVGLPMAAVFTFPNAIMADIIDYDGLRTGMRREAIYYGTQATLEKMASALYAPILALVLLLGDTAANPLGIRLVGPVAGFMSLLGWLTFRGYRLPDTVTRETVPFVRPAPAMTETGADPEEDKAGRSG